MDAKQINSSLNFSILVKQKILKDAVIVTNCVSIVCSIKTCARRHAMAWTTGTLSPGKSAKMVVYYALSYEQAITMQTVVTVNGVTVAVSEITSCIKERSYQLRKGMET